MRNLTNGHGGHLMQSFPRPTELLGGLTWTNPHLLRGLSWSISSGPNLLRGLSWNFPWNPWLLRDLLFPQSLSLCLISHPIGRRIPVGSPTVMVDIVEPPSGAVQPFLPPPGEALVHRESSLVLLAPSLQLKQLLQLFRLLHNLRPLHLELCLQLLELPLVLLHPLLVPGPLVV